MSYDATVRSDNPFIYYHLKELSGTVATDSSGNGSNGTIASTGVTYAFPGPIVDTGSAAMGFDGVAGFVSGPTTGAPTGNNPWSMEGWFNLQAFSATSVLMSFGTGVTNEEPNMYVNSSGQLIQSTWNTDQVVAKLILNTWYYLVTTYDGTNQVCYINAVSTATHAPGTVAIPATGIGLTIARNANASNFFASVRAQEVAFYAKALTASQIAAHFAAGLTALPLPAHGQWPNAPVRTITRPSLWPKERNVAGINQTDAVPGTNVEFYGEPALPVVFTAHGQWPVAPVRTITRVALWTKAPGYNAGTVAGINENDLTSAVINEFYGIVDTYGVQQMPQTALAANTALVAPAQLVDPLAALQGQSALVETSAQIVDPAVPVVASSALIETFAQIDAPVTIQGQSALVETLAIIQDPAIPVAASSLITESAQIVDPSAPIIASSLITEVAQLVEPIAAEAAQSALTQTVGQVVDPSVPVVSNSLLSVTGTIIGFINGSATMIANTVLAETLASVVVTPAGASPVQASSVLAITGTVVTPNLAGDVVLAATATQTVALAATLMSVPSSIVVQMLQALRDFDQQIYQPLGSGTALYAGAYINYLVGTSPGQVNWSSGTYDVAIQPVTGFGVPTAQATLQSTLAPGTYTSLTVTNIGKQLNQNDKFILGWATGSTAQGNWLPNAANMSLAVALVNNTVYTSISVSSVPFALLSGTQLQIAGGGHSAIVTLSAAVSASGVQTSLPINSFTANHAWSIGATVSLSLAAGMAGPILIPIASLTTTTSFSGNILGPYPPAHDATVDLRNLQALYRYRKIAPSDQQFGTISDDGTVGSGYIKNLHDIVVSEWAGPSNENDSRGWLWFALWDIYVKANKADTGVLAILTAMLTNWSASYHSVAGGPSAGTIYYTDANSTPRTLGFAQVPDQIDQACALYLYGTLMSNATYITQAQTTIAYLWSVGMCQTSGGATIYNVLAQNIAGLTDGAGNFATPIWDSTIGDANAVYPGTHARTCQNLMTTYLVTGDSTLLTKAQAILDQLDYSRTTLPNNGLGPGLWDSTNLGYVFNLKFTGTAPSAVTGITYQTGSKEAGRQMQTLDAFTVASILLSNRYATVALVMLSLAVNKAFEPALSGVPYQVNPDWTPQATPPIATGEASNIVLVVLLNQPVAGDTPLLTATAVHTVALAATLADGTADLAATAVHTVALAAVAP